MTYYNKIRVTMLLTALAYGLVVIGGGDKQAMAACRQQHSDVVCTHTLYR